MRSDTDSAPESGQWEYANVDHRDFRFTTDNGHVDYVEWWCGNAWREEDAERLIECLQAIYHDRQHRTSILESALRAKVEERKKEYSQRTHGLSDDTSFACGVMAMVEEIEALLSSTATPLTSELCGWTQPDYEEFNTWDTGCGHCFMLESGKPSDNDMRFCCYCGKLIHEEVYSNG